MQVMAWWVPLNHVAPVECVASTSLLPILCFPETSTIIHLNKYNLQQLELEQIKFNGLNIF